VQSHDGAEDGGGLVVIGEDGRRIAPEQRQPFLGRDVLRPGGEAGEEAVELGQRHDAVVEIGGIQIGLEQVEGGIGVGHMARHCSRTLSSSTERSEGHGGRAGTEQAPPSRRCAARHLPRCAGEDKNKKPPRFREGFSSL